MKRSRDVKNLKQLSHIWHTCLLTGGGSSAGGSGADCKLGLTILRPNLPSTPETFGNWTDGCISCRHSTPTSLLVFPSSFLHHFFSFCRYYRQIVCHRHVRCLLYSISSPAVAQVRTDPRRTTNYHKTTEMTKVLHFYIVCCFLSSFIATSSGELKIVIFKQFCDSANVTLARPNIMARK